MSDIASLMGQQQAQRAFGSNALQCRSSSSRSTNNGWNTDFAVLGFVDRKSDACAFVVNPYYEHGATERDAEAA